MTAVNKSGRRFVEGMIPERHLEVDAARLLLILVRFMRVPDGPARRLRCYPSDAVVGHFTPEYYLHKLDFLLRYPSYFAYELTELFRLGIIPAADRDEIMGIVRMVKSENEPELHTSHYRRFWRGAYERLDNVEAWWRARKLVYSGTQLRGDSPPQKHYFVTPLGGQVAAQLIEAVPHVRWYASRIDFLHRFFGPLTAAEVKALQYNHPEYRAAQLHELIPDLAPEDVANNFATVFNEPLEVGVE